MSKILNLLKKLIPKKIFKFFQPAYHFLLAFTGNVFYGFPGRKIVCIGVTGTNGKSTTVELINSVLKEAGYKTGMLSTIAFEIAGARADNETSRTTLGRWQTPKKLKEMVRAGCTHAVIEVASEGIVQYRVWGIPFDVAVFTNLTPEHLNTHGTMKKYRDAKGKLFLNLAMAKRKKNQPKISVVNADDKEGGYFSAFPADKSYTFGIKKGDLRARNIVSAKELRFELLDGTKVIPFQSRLIGAFNALNILAAWGVGKGLGIDEKTLKRGVEAVNLVKGRMEEIPNKKGPRIFVDYAMTPDSYEMLLSEMRKLTKQKLIIVFGAAGDRDRNKRPIIGGIAAKMADYSILTDDEPYGEDPKKIISEIESGFKKLNKKNYEIISDRKKALKRAVNIATKDDVIVVPGMGHEKWRNVGGNKKIFWDEVEQIKKILK